MISRDLANCLHVHAFEGDSTGDALTPYVSCSAQAGYTCAEGLLSTAAIQSEGITSGTAGAHGGRIIDRLGFKQNYNSVALLADAWGWVWASSTTANARFMGVSLGLQDSSSTCSADFAAYSTALWKGRQALTLFAQTTSTNGAFWSSCGDGVEADLVSPSQSGVLTTAVATSSGFMVLINSPITVLPLTGAKRYLRMLVAPSCLVTVTECAAPMHVIGSLLFGDPDKGPGSTSPQRGRTFVTSGTST